jgi:homoserine kinase
MEQISVRIPATTANLGPGFDCLGVALQLHNTVTLSPGTPGEPDGMVEEAAAAFFLAAGLPAMEFAWSVSGDVPKSRGLGSSVTVRMGILHALNKLNASPLDDRQLYQLCTRLEGHPDNAAPAAFGGFAAARPDSVCFHCPVSPDLHFVLLVPDDEIRTDASRLKLPPHIPHADAVQNTARAALVTAAFASGRYDLLRGSMGDWLHQPYRAPAIPHLLPAIKAGVEAGALDGFLSGSGSAVACVTLDTPEHVAAAMHATLPAARVLILQADNTGTRVLP